MLEKYGKIHAKNDLKDEKHAKKVFSLWADKLGYQTIPERQAPSEEERETGVEVKPETPTGVQGSRVKVEDLSMDASAVLAGMAGSTNESAASTALGSGQVPATKQGNGPVPGWCVITDPAALALMSKDMGDDHQRPAINKKPRK